MRILCVCLGNICRSPAAEAVLRKFAPDWMTVDSAGTGGWHIGDPPHPPMIMAAKIRGFNLSHLRARQFSAEDFDAFDLILAMDRQNLADIEGQRPPGNRTPVRLMLDYAPKANKGDVPDPYYTGNFDEALDLIELAARGVLVAHIE